MRTQQISIGKLLAAVALATLLPVAACRAQAAQDPTAPASPAAVPQAPALPEGVNEVLKLQKGGVSADIILHYVNNSPLSFYLSADNIIYVQQQGVAAQVITAMIQRNGDMQRQVAQAQTQLQAVPAPATPAPAVSYGYPPEDPSANFNNALQARAASVDYSVGPTYPVYYPTYYDSYGYYPYGFNYWPTIGFGVGFRGVGFGGRGGFVGHSGGFVGHGGGFVGGAGHGGFSGGHAGGGHR